jgi:Tol biopolymer transport system component
MAGVGEVAVSPDGKRLAIATRGRVAVRAIAGGEASDLGEGGCPTWAPDGQHLAVCTADGSVVIIDVATKDRRALEGLPGPSDPTAWSPDGMTIALSIEIGGNREVYLQPVDGSPGRRLTTSPGDQMVDVWLPQGLLVTSSLASTPDGNWYLVDAATGATRRIPWLGGIPAPVRWVP